MRFIVRQRMRPLIRLFAVGQAFSQTYKSVTLPIEAFQGLLDVERNGRVFSDGKQIAKR